MCEKRKDGAECIRSINKIQRSNERVSQDKESPERHNDSLQNIRCIPHGSFGLSQGKSSSKKNVLVDKISLKT